MNRLITRSVSLFAMLLVSACGAEDPPASPGTTGSTSAGTGGSTATSGTGGTIEPGTGGTGGTGGQEPQPDPVGTEGDGDFEIGPDYTDAPEVKKVDGVPEGKSFSFTMYSKDSAIFTGHDPTLDADKSGDFQRNVTVVVPASYTDGSEAPFMVVQDARDKNEIVNTINNLIADKSKPFPSVVAIFVQNGGNDSYGSERGLEYDTMSDAYQRFIDTEVLPAITGNADLKVAYPNFKFTTNPEGRSSYGCSSGGAAALSMGWFGKDTYRRIVTYSGTFVDQQNPKAPTEAEYPHGAWEYADKLILDSEPKPLRVFLQVGDKDLGWDKEESSYHNWVLANKKVAAAMKTKGYHYRFVFSKGAGHCDGAVIRQTLPDTMRWMWRGYPVN